MKEIDLRKKNHMTAKSLRIQLLLWTVAWLLFIAGVVTMLQANIVKDAQTHALTDCFSRFKIKQSLNVRRAPPMEKPPLICLKTTNGVKIRWQQYRC